MAKSEIHTIHVWWTVENLVFQHTGGRENDFAISIKCDEDPTSWVLRTFGDGCPKGLVIWAVKQLSHFWGYHSDRFFNSIH
jgi:hypothetical protein